MENKEKQVEEIAKVMHDRSREIAENPCGIALLLEQGKTLPDDYAEALYNANCRILLEGSVVISKEDLNKNYVSRDTYDAEIEYRKVLEKRVGKETAEKAFEIAKKIIDKKYAIETPWTRATLSNIIDQIEKEFAKQFSVEVR